MNVGLISLYLPSGSKIGVGYQVHMLAERLVARGHRVTVFSPCPQPTGAAYRVEVVPERKPLSTFRFAWDLRRIDFSRFDVLHAHGDDWFLWGTRRPRHVHTFHGSMLMEMLHIRGLKRRLRMGLLAACEQPAAWLADETVAVSENTRRAVMGIRHVIPCGVDLGEFRPARPGEKADRPTVLFVGTMHGRKRGRMLVKAFREHVAPAVPGARLWCVCDRPAEGVEGDGEDVTWLGRVPHERLLELYRRAWVFCLPSSYEGFGVPYIEAMASGTAVVATPNAGAREVLRDGHDGRLVRPADVGGEVARMLTCAEERSTFVTRGLERSRVFHWDAVCDAYETLYAA